MYLFNQKIEITEAKATQLFGQPNKTENKLDFIINLIKKFNIVKYFERKVFLKELSREIKTIPILGIQKENIEKIQNIIDFIKKNNYSISKIEAKFNKKNNLIGLIIKNNEQLNTIDQQANIIKSLTSQISKKDHIIMEKTKKLNEVSRESEFRGIIIESLNEKEKRKFQLLKIENIPTILRIINVGAFCILGLVLAVSAKRLMPTQ